MAWAFVPNRPPIVRLYHIIHFFPTWIEFCRSIWRSIRYYSIFVYVNVYEIVLICCCLQFHLKLFKQTKGTCHQYVISKLTDIHLRFIRIETIAKIFNESKTKLCMSSWSEAKYKKKDTRRKKYCKTCASCIQLFCRMKHHRWKREKKQLNVARITRVCDEMMAEAFCIDYVFRWRSAGRNHDDDAKDKATGAK